MELPDVGKNCFLSTCKQLDFLPVKCDACANLFCKEHSTYDAHSCVIGQSKDRRVPVCPLCSQPISMAANDNPDLKVNEHIENHCKSDLAKHKRSNRCKVKGCKERQLVPILCVTCKQNYCLRHRHENDHECSAKSTSQSQNRAASSKARQAALDRLQRNATTKPRGGQTKNTSTSFSSSSASSTRNPPIASYSTTNKNAVPVNSYQSHNPAMSEDEALQLALQASLAESSFQPTSNQQSAANQNAAKQMTRQEIEDMQLAKALQESENEARQNTQQPTSKSKDSCLLS